MSDKSALAVPLPQFSAKPVWSSLPFLHSENVPTPDSLIEKAMFEIAVYLRNLVGILRPDFHELCRSLTKDGSDWIAVEIAIRRHLAAKRIQLSEVTTTERRFDEDVESYYDVDITNYYVVANDSLFQWWQEELRRQTDVRTNTEDKQPADDSPSVAAKPQNGEQQPPNVPKDYLSSWREILDALGKANNTTEQRRVRDAHAKFPGPIIMPTHGGQPKVVKGDLLVWWNGLEDRYREEATERDSVRADRSATVENQFDLGRGDHEETVVPEIAGRVKRRRGST